MKNSIKNFFGLMLLVSLFSVAFASCGDDEEKITPGDKTVLLAKITAAETLANAATTADYPAEAISTFKTSIATVKSAAAGEISAQQVTNLLTQLEQAQKLFLSKAYGAIPEEALLIGLDFDTENQTELTTTGIRTLKAKLVTGPAEIFGTDTSKPTFVAGVKGGKALMFDKGGHLEIDAYSNNDFIANKLTIATWVKPTVTKNANRIAALNFWENWKFEIQGNGKPFFTLKTTKGIGDMDNENDNSAAHGVWSHLVVTYDLTAKKLWFYVNGVLSKEWTSVTNGNLDGTIGAAYVPKSTAQLPLIIGATTTYAEALAAWTWGDGWKQPSEWGYYEGALDNFKIYNITLNAGQVAKLYKDEKP